MLLVLTTNMAAVTSCANQQLESGSAVFFRSWENKTTREKTLGVGKRNKNNLKPQRARKKKKLRTPACPLGK